MPLVQLFKARQAFRRSKKLKGRPEWQDVVPDTKQGRDAYKIADKYQARFSRAFMDAMRGLLEDPDVEKRFKAAWKTGSITEAMNALPLYQEGISQDDPVWRKFFDRLKSAYSEVIQASGDAATKEINQALDTNLKFTVSPEQPEGPDVEILKAKKKKKKKPPVVPVNPYSVPWMEEHTLELVTQGIGPQQRKVVQSVLMDTFERGVRAEETYNEIKSNIGLTDREYKAVKNRRAKLMEEDFPPERVERETTKYKEQLTRKRAQRIARTETIFAQAAGRSGAWKVAQEAGALPPVQRLWIAPPPSPNPNRPCEICLELDGKTAPVNGVYESALAGPIPGPPAHPSCRCTETLVRA
jgi:hypothetical protein